MNIAKKISFFVLAAMLMASCKDNAKEEAATEAAQTETVAANVATTSFKIDGMTCPMGCAKTIESKLAGMEGVQNATVDYDSKTATISYDAAKQSPEKLVETVEGIADGAYKVSEVHNSADQAMLYSNDQEPKKKESKKKKSEKKEEKSCSTEGKKSCCGGAGKSCGEKKA